MLNLLLYALRGVPPDGALLAFLAVDEHLVDIGDDLVDYEVRPLPGCPSRDFRRSRVQSADKCNACCCCRMMCWATPSTSTEVQQAPSHTHH